MHQKCLVCGDYHGGGGNLPCTKDERFWGHDTATEGGGHSVVYTVTFDKYGNIKDIKDVLEGVNEGYLERSTT